MLQCVRAMNLAVGLLSVSTAALAADDGFMAIHMANQKIGAAVANYWAGVARADAVASATDGFMAIHMDNQKTGSEVWRYWRSTTVTASN